MLANLSEAYRSDTVKYDVSGERLDLRFLEFNNTDLDDDNPTLNLTERGQNIGETNYVAVSYTWQRFDPITNAEAVSRFKVLTGGSDRKARSQDAILQRAIEFAKATNTRFIWIDQDCIDQRDPGDIERHLHVVHKIFHQSRHAIGLLSFHVFRQSQVDSIRYIYESTCCLRELDRLLLGDSKLDGLEIARKMTKAFRIFTAISADKWFSRTWTFMERLSAPHMRLLLPCEAPLSADEKIRRSRPDELELSLHWLHDLQTKFGEVTHTYSNDREVVCGRQSSKQALCDIVDRFGHLLSSKYLAEFSTPPWTQKLTLRQVADIFGHIEQHDNTVLSDCLLVLGYLCGFRRRFETALLNHYQYSYSTSVFVLLLMNGLLGNLKQTTTASFLWNHTLGETLAYYCSLRDQAGSDRQTMTYQESVDSVLDQEDIGEEFLEKVYRLFANR